MDKCVQFRKFWDGHRAVIRKRSDDCNTFWTFNGHGEIEPIWQNLIEKSFEDVHYIDPTLTVIDKDAAIVASNWKMNNATGIITNKTRVMQTGGTAKLRIDEFAVTGE